MIGSIVSGVLRQRAGGRSAAGGDMTGGLEAAMGSGRGRSRSGYGRRGAGALVGGLVARQVVSAMRRRRVG